MDSQNKTLTKPDKVAPGFKTACCGRVGPPYELDPPDPKPVPKGDDKPEIPPPPDPDRGPKSEPWSPVPEPPIPPELPAKPPEPLEPPNRAAMSEDTEPDPIPGRAFASPES
jgi:hypothetical protein